MELTHLITHVALIWGLPFHLITNISTEDLQRDQHPPSSQVLELTLRL